MKHDPLRAAFEIREQMSPLRRRLGFFCGAGTSMAVGIPGIDGLTISVSERLEGLLKEQYENIKKDITGNPNVENILDRIRIYRELIGDSEEKEIVGIKGATSVKNLDSVICQAISDIVKQEPQKESKPHLVFAQWLRALHSNRDFPVELFTTNYDLLIEQAMESASVPFFDGFIGSVHPFFVPESVEAEPSREGESIYPPRAWTRLWKLHGSINWHLPKDPTGTKGRVIRLSGAEIKKGEELAIFPSREKYAQSRKLPFITFQDRLRRFLSIGECLVIVIGYGFSDEHLNEIMFQGLRSNPHLTIIAFMYLPLIKEIIRYGEEYRNLTICGPDKMCIGGMVGPWSEPGRKQKQTDNWPFWDNKSKKFMLGDFNSFASFLEAFIGFRSSISDVLKNNGLPKDIQMPGSEGVQG